MDDVSADALSRRDFQAEGCNGVILASLLQSTRKATSSEVTGGSAPVAVSAAVEAFKEEALHAPMVATLKPSPDPKGRAVEVMGAAVVLAFA